MTPMGLVMLTMPRERAKSNTPISVNPSNMAPDRIVVVTATRAL